MHFSGAGGATSGKGKGAAPGLGGYSGGSSEGSEGGDGGGGAPPAATGFEGRLAAAALEEARLASASSSSSPPTAASVSAAPRSGQGAPPLPVVHGDFSLNVANALAAARLLALGADTVRGPPFFPFSYFSPPFSPAGRCLGSHFLIAAPLPSPPPQVTAGHDLDEAQVGESFPFALMATG